MFFSKCTIANIQSFADGVRCLFPAVFNWWIIWDEVFKSGPSKICGGQPLKSLKGYDLRKQIISSRPYLFKVFKGCLPQILLVHSRILCPIFNSRKCPQKYTIFSNLHKPSFFFGCCDEKKKCIDEFLN